MSRQQIINYDIKQKVVPVLVDGAYTVAKRGRFTRWVIRKLLKYGVIKHYLKELICYNSVVIDQEKILDLIQEQFDNLMERGERPTTIIIGRKAMRDLDLELRQTMRFNMAVDYYEGPGIRKLLGLEVKCLPYIDGVVLF